MKKIKALVLGGLMCLILFGSCTAGLDTPGAGGELTFVFYLQDSDGGTVLLDPAGSADVEKVELSGVGTGQSDFSIPTGEAELRIPQLLAGRWDFEARALNYQGKIIASGAAALDLTAAHISHDMLLTPVGAESSMALEISWPEEEYQDAVWTAEILSADTAVQPLNPGQAEPGRAAASALVEPGMYVLRIAFEAMETGSGRMISTVQVFPFYIAPGIEMSAAVSLLPAGDGDPARIQCIFDPVLITPKPISIEGAGPPFFTGRGENFTARDPGGGLAPAGIQWFAGGVRIGEGSEISIERAEPGIASLRAAVFSDNSIYLGDLEAEFQSPYRVGPFVLLAQVESADGLRGLSVNPEASLLAAAGYSNDSLLLYRRDAETGALSFLTEVADSAKTPLDGISDTAFSPAAPLLATTAKNSGSLVVWEIGDIDGPPERLLNPFCVCSAGDPGFSFLGGGSSAEFSADGEYLYVTGSGADSLAVLRLPYAAGGQPEIVQTLGAEHFEAGLFDGPTQVALSRAVAATPDEAEESGETYWAAVACKDGDSLFLFEREPDSGLLSHIASFSDESGGIGELNGVQRLAFCGPHLYSSSYYDDAVCLFSWIPDSGGGSGPAGAGEWIYSGSWENFDAGPGGTSGISAEAPIGQLNYSQEIAVSPDGSMLALAAGGNDALCIFERNPSDGSLSPLAAAADGTSGLPGLENFSDPLEGFDGARSVQWSPDGKNLYCGAANSGRINVMQEVDIRH